MSRPTQSLVSGAVFGAATILCWAAYNVAAKAGIDAALSPAALSFLRYTTPGLIAVPVWVFLIRHPQGRRVPFGRLVLLALLGGPIFGLIAVSGYEFAPLSHGLLFAPVAVFVTTTICSAIFLRERISVPRLFGAVVMFSGLALLVGVETRVLDPRWPVGIALFVAAGAMWGVYTALLRFWQIPLLEGTAAVASLGAVCAAITLGPWAWPSLHQATPGMLLTQIVMQGLVGGVVSVIALVAAIRHISAQTASMLPTFTPAVALLIAWATVGTQPQPIELIGAVIIFAGFALATRKHLSFGVASTRSRSAFQSEPERHEA